MFRHISMYAAMLWLCCAALPARADDKVEAKKHFEAGLALQKADDFAAAAVEFELSVKLFPTTGAQYNLANCYRALHRYAEALAAFEVLKNKDKGLAPRADVLKDVEIQIDEINTFVARLHLAVSRQGAGVTVDGQFAGQSPLSAPLVLSPGAHTIQVTLEGFEPVERTVSLVAREDKTETIELKPKAIVVVEQPRAKEPLPVAKEPEPALAPQDQPSPSQAGFPWKWVAFGVGGAAGIAAVITGALATTGAKEVKDDCTDNICPESLKDDAKRSETLGTVTNVLIGAAAAGVAAGIVLAIVDAKEDHDAIALRPALTPESAGLAVEARF